MMEYNGIQLNEKLIPILDKYMWELKKRWYADWHQQVTKDRFVSMADEWFKSSKLVNIHGWAEFPCADVIMGNTHYIESFIMKQGWDNFQVLPEDYGYYGMMGKFGTEAGNLTPNMPLIVSLPNWKYADIRPEWDDVLKECEEKNIDIHIDFAWLTTSRDIDFDVGHPCIKSFAMSMSKYNMQWNRVGLRWTKQRTMDSVTMFNHYYGDVNSGIMSCGAYMIAKLPRDYAWDTYGEKYDTLCDNHNLIKTKIIHTVKIPGDDYPKGVGHLLASHL